MSERLASNVVRDVRQRLIPAAARRGQEELAAWSASLSADGVDERLDALSRRLCRDVGEGVAAATAAAAAADVLDATLGVLLPNDVLPPVARVCAAISLRLTRQKVREWTDRHVTVGQFASFTSHHNLSITISPKFISLFSFKGIGWGLCLRCDQIRSD